MASFPVTVVPRRGQHTVPLPDLVKQGDRSRFCPASRSSPDCDGTIKIERVGYRDDLDLQAFVTAADLDVMEETPANLFGYSTVIVCRNRRR